MVNLKEPFSVGEEAIPKGASPFPRMESSQNWPGTKRKVFASSSFRKASSRVRSMRSLVSTVAFWTTIGMGRYGFFITFNSQFAICKVPFPQNALGLVEEVQRIALRISKWMGQ